MKVLIDFNGWMIMEKQELLGSFCFFFLLENIRMRFYVMLCLYMLLIYCWGDLWNFREKPSVIGWRTCILFKKMGRHSHLYYCPLDKCMKINWNWKETVKPKKKINHVRMWERVKIKWAKKEKGESEPKNKKVIFDHNRNYWGFNQEK